MKTLGYYCSNGDYKQFDKYTIDENGVVINVETNIVVPWHRNNSGYNTVRVVDNDGNRISILVGRAIASTFIGKPPNNRYTTDHINRNSLDDRLENIRWESKNEQRNNQERPVVYNSALIVVKDDVEKTTCEWVQFLKDELNPFGRQYTDRIIHNYARKQQHGFRYKVFDNIPGEEWKVVEGSHNKWYVSSEGRMKYKTCSTENVLSAEKLCKLNGYPVVRFANKLWYCHVIAFKTFFPEEYASKKDDEFVLHAKDNKFDFRPKFLTIGNRSQNTIDAHNNGCFDNSKRSRKPVTSYISGIFEQEHQSMADAAKYLRQNDCPRANTSGIFDALKTNSVRYGRTWKRI